MQLQQNIEYLLSVSGLQMYVFRLGFLHKYSPRVLPTVSLYFVETKVVFCLLYELIIAISYGFPIFGLLVLCMTPAFSLWKLVGFAPISRVLNFHHDVLWCSSVFIPCTRSLLGPINLAACVSWFWKLSWIVDLLWVPPHYFCSLFLELLLPSRLILWLFSLFFPIILFLVFWLYFLRAPQLYHLKSSVKFFNLLPYLKFLRVLLFPSTDSFYSVLFL